MSVEQFLYIFSRQDETLIKAYAESVPSKARPKCLHVKNFRQLRNLVTRSIEVSFPQPSIKRGPSNQMGSSGLKIWSEWVYLDFLISWYCSGDI